MTRDQLPNQIRQGPSAPGRLVVAGVAGALVLGVTLGVWARPGDPGAPTTRVVARTRPSTPQPVLQVVVREAPAPPVGELLEVLPARLPSPRPFELDRSDPVEAPPPIEPAAPRRPTSGLMKVDAPQAFPPPVLARAVRVEPRADPPRPARTDDGLAKARRAKAKLAEARAADARAEKARAEEARLASVKAKKAAALAEARDAKLEMARLSRLETAAKVAKAQKARAVKLAKAEVRSSRKAEKIAVKTEAKAKRSTVRPMKAVTTEPARVARPKPVKVAAVRPAPKKPAAKAAPKAAPAARRPAPRDDGSLRIARAPERGCYSPDPGEAIVCADQRLGQRDRQLQAAYRSAEAAGVPASTLRRQQDRWQQARAAAAREAPWAVEDVYVARISELKDQTRDAQED